MREQPDRGGDASTPGRKPGQWHLTVEGKSHVISLVDKKGDVPARFRVDGTEQPAGFRAFRKVVTFAVAGHPATLRRSTRSGFWRDSALNFLSALLGSVTSRLVWAYELTVDGSSQGSWATEQSQEVATGRKYNALGGRAVSDPKVHISRWLFIPPGQPLPSVAAFGQALAAQEAELKDFGGQGSH